MRIDDVVPQLELDVLELGDEVVQQLIFGDVGGDDSVLLEKTPLRGRQVCK
jgi:hypothetical protein